MFSALIVGKVRFDDYTAMLTALLRFCFCVVGIAGVLASCRDSVPHLPFLLNFSVSPYGGQPSQ